MTYFAYFKCTGIYVINLETVLPPGGRFVSRCIFWYIFIYCSANWRWRQNRRLECYQLQDRRQCAPQSRSMESNDPNQDQIVSSGNFGGIWINIWNRGLIQVGGYLNLPKNKRKVELRRGGIKKTVYVWICRCQFLYRKSLCAPTFFSVTAWTIDPLLPHLDEIPDLEQSQGLTLPYSLSRWRW